MEFHAFHWISMDSPGVGWRAAGWESACGAGWLAGWLAGRLALKSAQDPYILLLFSRRGRLFSILLLGFPMISFRAFRWTSMDLPGFGWRAAGWGSACGAGWLAGRQAGRLAGRWAGWLAGRESCSLIWSRFIRLLSFGNPKAKSLKTDRNPGLIV